MSGAELKSYDSAEGKRSINVQPASSTRGQEPLVGKDQHKYGTSHGTATPHTTVFMVDKDQASQMSHEAKLGATVSFHSINYDVQVAKKGCCKGTQPKRILNDVR